MAKESVIGTGMRFFSQSERMNVLLIRNKIRKSQYKYISKRDTFVLLSLRGFCLPPCSPKKHCALRWFPHIRKIRKSPWSISRWSDPNPLSLFRVSLFFCDVKFWSISYLFIAVYISKNSRGKKKGKPDVEQGVPFRGAVVDKSRNMEHPGTSQNID